MKEMKFGLIGFSQGYYATNYTEKIIGYPGIKVVGCCDLGATEDYVRECAGITAEEFTDRNDISLFNKVKDLYNCNPDMVMITTEVWEHKKYIIEALERGCHVYAGKPLSFKVNDVLAVKEKLKEADRQLTVLPGQPLRYESGLKEMAEAVNRGDIGEPINIRLFLNHKAMIHQKWERAPEKSGGPLGTFGIYLFDIVRWLTGLEFVEIYADGGSFVFPQINCEDVIQITGKMENGALVNLNLVSTITWEFPFVMIDIIGTEGAIRSNYDNYKYIEQTADKTELGNLRYNEMPRREIYHFADCCFNKSEQSINLDDMLKAAEGIAAVQKSLKTGKVTNCRT